MFGSKSGSGASGRGRTSAEGGNGNVRDSSNPDGDRHAALLGGHSAAINDIRPDRGHAGKHRAE